MSKVDLRGKNEIGENCEIWSLKIILNLFKQFSLDGITCQNGHSSSKPPRLYTAFAICVISKYPYYNALRDCLSW